MLDSICSVIYQGIYHRLRKLKLKLPWKNQFNSFKINNKDIWTILDGPTCTIIVDFKPVFFQRNTKNKLDNII